MGSNKENPQDQRQYQHSEWLPEKSEGSRRAEKYIQKFLQILAYSTVFITFLILGILLVNSLQFFSEYSFWDFLTGNRWEPFGEPKYLGVLPLLSGTLMVAFGSALVAFPLGLGSAIYITQYASDKTREWIIPVVEILGGIPTVVYGYFALTAITPLLKKIFPGIETFNALSASIVVGLAILPMVSSISADALRQVPSSIIQAGYALGMRKLHVSIRIIIPAAASGIFSSFILAFSRAVGETMAVTLAAGATPNMNWNFLEGIQTVTAYIVQVSLGDTPVGSIEYYTIYALGLTLFALTFFFNYMASIIVRKFQEQYQ